MNDTRSWVIMILVALMTVALVAFARGLDHHRGDEIGALPRSVSTTAH